jgi:endonuclease YncB( thermonuclease family)
MAQTVTDGDTIKLDGARWRLWGIDAPEMHQTCADGWTAGVQAKHQLEQLMAGGSVVCEFRGHDRCRRSIGLCRAGGRDLAEMVAQGWLGPSPATAPTMWARSERRSARGSECTRRLHEGVGLAARFQIVKLRVLA